MVRLPAHKSNWQQKKLGEVAVFLDGKRRPVKESERNPGPYPYYGANGQQGTISGYIFDEPLILLAEDGGHFRQPERGIAYKIQGKSWVNNHAHVLKPKDETMNIDFLLYQLRHYDVTPFISGTTRDKLTKGSAEAIPVVCPPMPIQVEIAERLTAMSKAQELREISLGEADEYLHSLFVEMFGDPVANPKGWPLKALSEVVGEFRYGTSNRAVGGKYPVLRIPNITGDLIDLSDLKYVDLTDAEAQRLLMKDGDILFVRTNGNPEYIARANVFDLPGDYVYASYLIRARLDLNRMNPRFLISQLRISSMRSLVMSKTSTTAGQYNINTENLGSIPVVVPLISEQGRFAEISLKIMKLRTTLADSEQGIRKLFESVLSESFR